jgi:hypothetical protein
MQLYARHPMSSKLHVYRFEPSITDLIAVALYTHGLCNESLVYSCEGSNF